MREQIDIMEGVGMEWYKNLTVDQKINIKECFLLLCGVKWEALTSLFSIRQRVEIMYNKLKKEGFEVVR